MKHLLKCFMVLFLFLSGCTSTEKTVSSAEADVRIHISEKMLTSLNTDAKTYVDSLSSADRKNFKKVQTGKDGSVTLVMSRKANRAWLREYTDTVDEAIEKFENSSEYSIAKITFNRDYTTLKITEKGEQAPLKDVLLVMPLAVYGEMYQLMSGVKEEDIRIHCVVRSASGIQIDDVTYPDDLPAESEGKS